MKNHIDSSEDIMAVRHSLAHLLAAAVLVLWPDTKPTIGPAIEYGFYYDFEFPLPISQNDLPAIEAKMKELLKTWDAISSREISEKEAKSLFSHNPYKIELINEIAMRGEKITLYRWGDFEDLCKGGHIENAASLKPDAFKLFQLAGAYWRGNEKNQMLTRIYGLAFATKDELAAHLKMLELAEKRDHRKLGKDLDLFIFSNTVGAGLALWTPKGTILRNLLDDFVWQLRQVRGYTRVTIPHITKRELYETSGHWEKFQNDLFKITTREGHDFAMKPMNCPHHTQIYNRMPHSYRDMPQKYAETSMCYRDEQTGELIGLSRVRAFTQDDAHVFCRENQIKHEVLLIWDIINTFYETLGFGQLKTRLSLHDPGAMDKYLGDGHIWVKTENQLRAIIKERGVEITEALGEAAFYGPKLDFMAKDSIGRWWQVATIQIDFNQPERFDLVCINEKGERERIFMIHAAIMGSIERFLSIYIEHCAGAFPVWLAPVQVIILPVGEAHHEPSKKFALHLSQIGIRALCDDSSETVGKKIRNALKQKIPYMLVIGDKEKTLETLTVRKRGLQEMITVSYEEFFKRIREKVDSKALDL